MTISPPCVSKRSKKLRDIDVSEPCGAPLPVTGISLPLLSLDKNMMKSKLKKNGKINKIIYKKLGDF
jgi:hypothetical protein